MGRIFFVILSGRTFAHQNFLVECFAVGFLVLIPDPFHVDFRAGHHDAGQDIFAGTFTLMGRKEEKGTCWEADTIFDTFCE